MLLPAPSVRQSSPHGPIPTELAQHSLSGHRDPQPGPRLLNCTDPAAAVVSDCREEAVRAGTSLSRSIGRVSRAFKEQLPSADRRSRSRLRKPMFRVNLQRSLRSISSSCRLHSHPSSMPVTVSAPTRRSNTRCRAQEPPRTQRRLRAHRRPNRRRRPSPQRQQSSFVPNADGRSPAPRHSALTAARLTRSPGQRAERPRRGQAPRRPPRPDGLAGGAVRVPVQGRRLQPPARARRVTAPPTVMPSCGHSSQMASPPRKASFVQLTPGSTKPNASRGSAKAQVSVGRRSRVQAGLLRRVEDDHPVCHRQLIQTRFRRANRRCVARIHQAASRTGVGSGARSRRFPGLRQ